MKQSVSDLASLRSDIAKRSKVSEANVEAVLRELGILDAIAAIKQPELARVDIGGLRVSIRAVPPVPPA